MSGFRSVALAGALFVVCTAVVADRSTDEVTKESELAQDPITPQYVGISDGLVSPEMDIGYTTHANKQILSPVKQSVRFLASPYKGFVVPKIDDPRPEETFLHRGKGGQEGRGIPFTKNLDFALAAAKKFPSFRQTNQHMNPRNVTPNMLPDMSDARPVPDLGFTSHINKNQLNPVMITTKHGLDVAPGFIHPVYDGAYPPSHGPHPLDATENWKLDPRLTRPMMGQGPADA